jgi:spore germination cell wall hydrolase CwlJ-like protein
MGKLRTRPKGVELAPFGLAALFLLVPERTGYQDLAALMAQQPAVSERWREHMIASPFGTIHKATFSLPRPLGTLIPEPLAQRLARFEPPNADITGAIPGTARGLTSDDGEPAGYPVVNRSAKGDRLLPLAPSATPAEAPEPAAAGGEAAAALPAAPAEEPGSDELQAAARYEPFPEYDVSMSLEMHPQVPTEAETEAALGDEAGAAQDDAGTIIGASRLFFDGGALNTVVAGIEPWTPGEEPVLMLPRAPAAAGSPHAAEGEIKPAAPAPAATAAAAAANPADAKDSVTVAGKGEVTGEGRRPKTPAEYLGLSGKARVKAEKCLSTAIYFESRGESARGQIGVAQVVLNRAFSGFYPGDVCGVVYQGANRHLSCQFTFACDGIPDVVTEQEPWERAKRIARDTLDGKLWLKEVGKSTHYHASWVYPYWVRSMRKLAKIGVHTFYRPRNWGDGADTPSWGSATATAEVATRL